MKCFLIVKIATAAVVGYVFNQQQYLVKYSIGKAPTKHEWFLKDGLLRVANYILELLCSHFTSKSLVDIFIRVHLVYP